MNERPSKFYKNKASKRTTGQETFKRFDFNDSKASPARLKAYECIRQIRLRKSYAHEMIERLIDSSKMDSADKAFAAKLVIGVVSMRGSLDEILNRAMNSPEDVSIELRDALVISTYEIIYLQKSPHAAVDQGVELARAIAPKATGLANSVLRKIVALRAAFPFGDPRKDINAYALLHGFPVWLVEEVIADLGATKAHEFLVASNTTAPLYIAVNDIKDLNAEVYETLIRAKADPQPVLIDDTLVPGCYLVAKHAVLNDGRVKRLVNKGSMLVSDAAAQSVANLVATHARPTSFLEIGSGRGTKTIMLQSGVFRKNGNQAPDFICIDNSVHKIELLKERAIKYGVNIKEAIAANAAQLAEALESQQFDSVFIDAPCTGLGTLRRHPEIRWRVTDDAINKYAALGVNLLNAAAPFVAPGGILAYSTCTVTKRENEEAIQLFLNGEEGTHFSIDKLSFHDKTALYFKTNLTSNGPDAHFCAILRKKL